MDTSVGKIFYFGRFQLDPGRAVLRHDGTETNLRPKTFNVLHHLVENSGRLVSKDELMQAVWPDVIVTEDSLVRCVHEARVALGDDKQQLIRTMPRRGYLFDIPVTLKTERQRQLDWLPARTNRYMRPGHAVSFVRELFRRHPLPIFLALAGALLIGTITHFAPSILYGSSRNAIVIQPSIAVMPFNNLSGDTAQDFFSDGFSEDLIVRLSRFSEFAVIARNSSFVYRGKTIRAKHVGQELGVRYLVFGSVRRDARQLRISAQLVDAQNEKQLWARQYDRSPSDVFALQDALTQEIVATLASKVRVSDVSRKISLPLGHLSAYDLVLRAREIFFRRATRQSTIEARELAGRAVRIDPSYAPAYVELGRTFYRAYALQWDGQAALDQALVLAETAISLDDTSAGAYELLGRIYLRQGQHTAAITTLEKALSINPNRAESYASLADALTFAGRPGEAVSLLKKSIRLDPHYPARFEMYLGRALYFEKRYREAEAPLRSCAARAPRFRACLMYLAPVYAELGETRAAEETVARLMDISPGFTVTNSVRKHLPFAGDAMRFYTAGLLKAGVPE